MAGYKHIQTRAGDTLQQIALRELGAASDWAQIAYLNGLKPPYITDDPAEVADGVVLSGSTLYVPVPSSGVVDSESDPFFTDIQLQGGAISVENGDMVLTAGDSNLLQALRHRIAVEKRELMFHPEYGCWVKSILGEKAATNNQLAAFYVKSSLLEDERVASIKGIESVVNGDSIEVFAEVVPVVGDSLSFSKVV